MLWIWHNQRHLDFTGTMAACMRPSRHWADQQSIINGEELTGRYPFLLKYWPLMDSEGCDSLQMCTHKGEFKLYGYFQTHSHDDDHG